MALAAAVQGGRLPAQLITWQHQDNTVEDFTGATLTGKILLQRQQAAQSITGTLTVTDATNGVFRWSYSADDVAYAGTHRVQFTATFTGVPAKTFITEWVVKESL